MATIVQGDDEFEINFTPSGATNTWENFGVFFDRLEGRGWVAGANSDGTTVGSGRVGAGLGNNNAWQVMANDAVSPTMWLTFQRATTTRSWRAWVDTIAPTGGTPTVAPSSAQRFQIIGAGGSFDTTFFANDATTQRIHCWANDDAVGGYKPFYFLVFDIGNTSVQRRFFADVLVDVADGVVGVPDNAPFFIYGSNNIPTSMAINAAGQAAHYLYGEAGERIFDPCEVCSVAVQSAPSTFGFPNFYQVADPYSGLYRLAQPWVARRTVPGVQLKGRTRSVRTPGPPVATVANLDTFNLTTLNAYVRVFDFALPWPQNVAPLV